MRKNAGQMKNGMIGGLRDKARAIRARFAGGDHSDTAPAQTSSPLFVAPPDPTIGRFGAEDAEENHPSLGQNLEIRLGESAEDITESTKMLARNAQHLQRVSAARSRGEKLINIFGFRMVIAIAWLMLAFWLNQNGLIATANGTPLASGMPADHALALSETFLLVGGVAAGVALFMIAIVFISGNGTNDLLRLDGADFGKRLAETARKYNSTLKSLREIAADNGKSPAAIVPAVSQAHLTALEARVFFEDISFLTVADRDTADGHFIGFMKRHCPPPAGFGLIEVLLGIALGVLTGLAFGFKLFSPSIDTGAAPKILEIMQYPGVVAALLGGGVAYLAMGILVELVSALFENRALTTARREVLDSVRSAYVAQEAPLASDVIRQVDDVVQILRARLTPGGGQNFADGESKSAFAPEDDEIPEWRRRDSSVKFVDTGFQAAPETWRTDAFEKKFTGDPEAKRGFKGFKKPAGD